MRSPDATRRGVPERSNIFLVPDGAAAAPVDRDECGFLIHDTREPGETCGECTRSGGGADKKSPAMIIRRYPRHRANRTLEPHPHRTWPGHRREANRNANAAKNLCLKRPFVCGPRRVYTKLDAEPSL